MFHHVGEWSRVVARDYRHHPLVSIFTSALMIPLSHCLALHRDLVQGHWSCRCPPASSHRAPFMISFSFHAATEHSEFDSLVMYARRKIVSVFVPGTSRAVPHFVVENGSRRYSVPDSTQIRCVCLRPHVEVSTRIIFIDKYLHNARFTEPCPNNSIKKFDRDDYVNTVKNLGSTKKRSSVVPQERPQILPSLRVPVQICHRIEHPVLDRFAAVLEQPHHRAP